MECLHCQKEFTSQRNGAKFCSNSCRTKHYNANQSHKPANAVINAHIQQKPGFMGLSGNASFDYMFQRTEAENAQLKGEISRLKDKYETLNDKYRDLKLDQATKDKLNEADKALEASKGLGGLIDKVTGNERLMDAIEKIVLHKMGVGDENKTDLLDGVEENKDLLEAILSIIRDQDSVWLAHFLKMSNYFAKNPSLLMAAANGIKTANKIIQDQKTA